MRKVIGTQTKRYKVCSENLLSPPQFKSYNYLGSLLLVDKFTKLGTN